MSMTILANAPVSQPQDERLGPTVEVGVVAGAMVAWGQISSGFGVPADDLAPFERERAAFFRRLPELLRTHRGQYVVISDGGVAAVGDSENEAAGKFFREHPDMDAYVGFVGNEPPAFQIRPSSR